ncbi:LysR family transcriptional regulator [Labrenzia sp. R4_1]|uniref:LysR family transcriptional regulator n=1 Tax=Labrenzia sp. R4_1 TaxID=2821106 RepID=UPI001ADB0AAF|nr:LysR family transcriptional regulator [Labrenzia sp. R4_1]MBO9425657.1 LysR family transcriptional regulator [Labrenzia sp. R4_1]
MASALPPLNWFRAFEASARHLSFTAAANEIGMTQSAVSQQIKALETKLGVPLFERKARGLTLTDDGRRLLPQVDAALDTLTAATRSFVPDKPKKLLTVSVSVSVLQWVIGPALPSFRAAYPDIALRFIGAIWPDEFSRSLADVVISFGSRKQAGSRAVLLGSGKLIALAPSQRITSLDTCPVIDTVGISGGWSEWRTATGISCADPSIYVDSYGAALDLSSNGNGLCLVNETLARHAVQSGSVVPVSPITIDANEAYFVETNPASQDAQTFREWLESTVGDGE